MGKVRLRSQTGWDLAHQSRVDDSLAYVHTSGLWQLFPGWCGHKAGLAWGSHQGRGHESVVDCNVLLRQSSRDISDLAMAFEVVHEPDMRVMMRPSMTFERRPEIGPVRRMGWHWTVREG